MMKFLKVTGLVALFLAQGLDTHAEGLFGHTTPAGSLLETTKQARERHSADRYAQQQSYLRGSGGFITAPLGGYWEPLGSPAPYGTLNPGMVHSKGMYGVEEYPR